MAKLPSKGVADISDCRNIDVKEGMKKKKKKVPGSGGIRTHAPEETGALNQRLRPLGHATLLGLDQTVLQVVFSLSHVSLPARLFFSLFSFFCAPLLL